MSVGLQRLQASSLKPQASSLKPSHSSPLLHYFYFYFPQKRPFSFALAAPLQPYQGSFPWKELSDGSVPSQCGAAQDVDALTSVELGACHADQWSYNPC
jgi:hypothetical protein